MLHHIVPSRESRSLTPPPEALLFEKLFQILLRGGDGSNAEILYKVVQHIGRNERRQRGAKANILDPQMQQRQQDRLGILAPVGAECIKLWCTTIRRLAVALA